MTPPVPRPAFWGLIALLAACGTLTSTERSTERSTQPEAPANPEVPEIPAVDTEVNNAPGSMVPSPLEIQAALEASGIQTQLATLIPARSFDTTAADPDRAAVRTGVVLADMLLTVKTSEKATLLSQLEAVDKGMEQLKGGSDIHRTIVEYKEGVTSGGMSRDDLLAALDEMSLVVIPELEFNGVARIVPLIKAGSWLEGANLLGRALKGVENKKAAEKLLKAPEVVDYFMEFVQDEGAGRVPEAVTLKLRESLATLKGLASKTEPLTNEDLGTVVKVTEDVMALL